MVIGAVIAACVVLFILALVAPRLSRGPQKGVAGTLGVGARAGGRAPGILGRFLSKSFSKSRKATNRSAEAGRKTHSKLRV
jgi:hypothetical protein